MSEADVVSDLQDLGVYSELADPEISDVKIDRILRDIDAHFKDGTREAAMEEATDMLEKVAGRSVDWKERLQRPDTQPFEAVDAVLDTYMPGFDKQAPRLLLASILANRSREVRKPVWPMFVGPPSCGKTEMLMPIEGIWDAELISKITDKTLLSGAQTSQGDASLLDDLGDNFILVIKELSNLLEMRYETRDAVLGQFREVWDGQMSASWGTGKSSDWRGYGVVVAAMTGAIDKYGSFNSQLGERFIRFRWRRLHDPKRAIMRSAEAAQEYDNFDDVGPSLHDAYRQALNVGQRNIERIEISKQMRERAADLTIILTHLRTDVDRNKYHGDAINTTPAVEYPHRAHNQLQSLAHALAALRNEDELTDWSLLFRVAFDGMKEPRRSLFRMISRKIADKGWVDKPNDLNPEASVSDRTVANVVEDLRLLGVLKEVDLDEESGLRVHKDGSVNGRPSDKFAFTEQFRKAMEASGFWTWLVEK